MNDDQLFSIALNSNKKSLNLIIVTPWFKIRIWEGRGLTISREVGRVVGEPLMPRLLPQ